MINPSLKDRQFSLHGAKIGSASAYIELVVTAEVSISEGLEADVTRMVFGEL